MTLETERLILRRPRIDDLDSLLWLLSDKTFAVTVPEIPRTEENLKKYLRARC